MAAKIKKNSTKKKMNIFLKIFLWIIGLIVGIFALVFGGLNALKFAIYSEYYGMTTTICENPGLGDGYITQGVAASEENEVIITSGYMTNKSASRIYIVNPKTGDISHVTLKKNGASFTGHVGGVAVTGDIVYLSTGSKIYTFKMSAVLASAQKEDNSVEIGEGINVNNEASFVYTDDTNLYVGEFHDGGAYVTDHPFKTPEGEVNHAILTKYSLTELTRPLEVYSIIDKVQGFCLTPAGNMVFSTSYGLSSSQYYVYPKSARKNSGQTLDGAPVYFLDGMTNQITGPAMSEDLDYYDGRVLTLTESASNKYIFGKLFFATNIDGLDIK